MKLEDTNKKMYCSSVSKKNMTTNISPLKSSKVKIKKMAEFLLNCIFLDVHLAVATPTTTEINKVDSWNVRPYNQIEFKPGKDEETDSVAFSHLIDSHDMTRNLSLELKWNRHFVGLEPQQEKKVYNGIPGDKIDIDKTYLSVLLI